MAEVPAIPRATYRLQFNAGFKFSQAREIVPYLAELGVSHLYASPYLKARAGSTHGYDIIDHNALNPEIGDEDEFRALSDELAAHGLGQILDFVPNHMGIGLADNAWWLDVLEWGEASPYAQYFDIDWYPAKQELRAKVLLPVLGDQYGRVLEAGELKLRFDRESGTFSFWYWDHRFPVTPGEYDRILRLALREYARNESSTSAVVVVLEDLLVGFRDVREWLPVRQEPALRRAEADHLKRQLAEVAMGAPGVAAAIDRSLQSLNECIDDFEHLTFMHELLEAQHYRLAYWRVAAEEINYRRFFQINDLAGIRVEVPEVFEATHRLVLELIADGRIHGVRIDHIDGLFDPKTYLERLQARVAEVRGRPPEEQAGEGTTQGTGQPFYIVVEKILAPHEKLRQDWPIAGTTGYDFLNRVNGLFVDPGGAGALQRIWERVVGSVLSFEEIAYDSKRQVMDFELASELRVLANEINRLTETTWVTRDYTLVGLRQALREVVSCFPVYRTYVDATGASSDDRRDIDWAVAHARKRSVRADKSVFDFLHGVLTTDLVGGPSPYSRREVRRLALKVQQFTGPVAAKGVEDTAFYRYNRLISTNEVGGEPSRFGTSVSAFHKLSVDSARYWPNAMLATATHDTKRGEDTRVRIDVLSELPMEWSRQVRHWSSLNMRRRSKINGDVAPTANDEYLFYQSLVGCWPAEFHGEGELDPAAVDALRERLSAYMIKAVREAKTHSSWINPDTEYEDALLGLVSRCLDVSRPNPFLSDFRAFHREIAVAGAVNGLAQAALKLTLPGIPDIYQGCELWDLSLVDPDNRRPVDFAARRGRLAEISAAFVHQDSATLAGELLHGWPDGSVKLFLTWRLLDLRQQHAALFEQGSYTPLEVEGKHAAHVFAFVRQHAGTRLVVAIPRLTSDLARGGRWPIGDEIWSGTWLGLPEDTPAGSWTEIFTKRSIADGGEGDRRRIDLAAAFATFPVAVLLQTA